MKKIKIWQWVLITVGATLTILAIFLIVPVIVMDKSWWWFFIPLIFFLVVYMIIGSIFLIIKLSKKSPPTIKIDLKDAKQKVIYEFKYDEDNPDNFKILNSRLERWGEKGAEKTPILILEGIGTENNDSRYAIINLNNPKQEMTRLIDPTKEEVNKAIQKIAEYPPEEEIREETTTGIDVFGRPVTTTKIRKPSSIEAKKKEEQEKVEELGAI